MSLTTRVLLALALGLAAGWLVARTGLAPLATAAHAIEPVGAMWVNAIRMTVIPLVVASLIVGVGSAIVACAVGASLGMLAAYAGGRTDSLVMRLVDLQLSFPAILAALMILAFLGKGILNVVIALVVVEWAYYARTVRGTALVERRREYIEAAQCLALPTRRIIFRHLLPNCLPPLIVVGTMQVARAIALEATLSFLGLGVPITEPSLGLLIANGYEYMLSGKYWISFYPGIALLVTIVSINLVGDHLRDVLNPRLQR